MPGIPLVSREANYSRDSEIRVHLSEEEQRAAEESLSVYCRPVEFYNLLQVRAKNNPLFLTRCLHYKIKEKHKRRVQVSVSISRPIDGGLQTQSLYPLYILLARSVPTPNGETMRSNCYRFKRACKLTAFRGAETTSSSRARFILPEINKLSTEVKSGSLAMLLVSCADITNPTAIDLTKDHMSSPSNDGYCLMGKIPIDFLHFSREKSPNISLGERAQFISTVSLKSCYMKLSCTDSEKSLSFHFPHNSEAVSILQQVPVIITAEELGAKDISPYDLYSYNNIPTDKLSQVIRLRTGNVIFNFKYYNNMLQRSEVTEDYCCAFCLLKCASYKGLRYHLLACHDLFNYEFWVDEDYQVVVVSPTTSTSEIFGRTVDPREESFFFCHKPSRSRKSGRQNQAGQLALGSHMPPALGVSERMDCEIYSPNAVGVSSVAGITSCGPESTSQSVPGSSSIAPTALLQFAKTRKLSVERSDPRNQALLHRGSFFHSHRAQPMAPEYVFGDEDSEDEVDDDVADLEDRRMLDDFVDVTQHEKQMMHLWNSFIRKQRVLADAHVPWACEAFSTQHGEEFIRNPEVLWCWNLFMIKLWNHGLLDAKTMNSCHLILENFREQNRSQPTNRFF
ncbi:putative polycomb protein, VEFS-Box [Helianthus annuus]|nr:putative polycomb protein, VEFS-Box [Helianthus annuus]